MTEYRKENVKPITLIKEAFGDEVVLEENGRDTVPYRLLAEFAIGDRNYAVLQSQRMKKDDEVSLFHIVYDEQGELQLETVLDDDEWETVLEVYDEMTVIFDET